MEFFNVECEMMLGADLSNRSKNLIARAVKAEAQGETAKAKKLAKKAAKSLVKDGYRP